MKDSFVIRQIVKNDVMTERHRQLEVLGYDTTRDQQYTQGELAAASAAYAAAAEMVQGGKDAPSQMVPSFWPWDDMFWKPSDEDPYRNMVKSMALGMAEMERIIYFRVMHDWSEDS